MQGTAAGYYIGRFANAQQITFADISLERAERAAKRVNQLLNSSVAQAISLDVRNRAQLVQEFKKVDGVMSAIDYAFNVSLTEAAIEAGVCLVDLGGNTDVVLQQLKLHERALLAGVSIVPDCGLAPGLGNTLAARCIELLDEVDRVQVRCGGLPQNPRPPLSYKLVFSVRGLTNEYFGRAWAIRNSKRVEIPTFSELENIEFPSPVGACEAFVTLGGSSTCPWTFESKVKNFDYKTVRYPGHYEKMKCLLDLGLLDLEPMSIPTVDGQRAQIAPREVFHELATKKLDFPEDKDLVVLRVLAEGKKSGQAVKTGFEILDFHDEATGFTAMERTTGYPAALVLVHATEGKAKKGVIPLENALNHEAYIQELQIAFPNLKSI